MSSYGTLLADVSEWLMTDEWAGKVPTFVRLAESRIARDIRIRDMTTRATLTGDGTRFIALPSDFLELRDLRYIAPPSSSYGGRIQLIQVSPSALTNRRDVRPAPNTGVTPVYYALLDTIEFESEVATDSTLELVYWARYPELSDTPPNDTNWLLQNGYGVYLYGTLLESAPYIEDDERSSTWMAAYNEHVNAVMSADIRSRTGNAPRVTTEDGGLLP